jgi:hypothetical protein
MRSQADLIFVEPGNRSLRGVAKKPKQKTASALLIIRLRPFVFEHRARSLGGGGSPPRGMLAVHHGTAARAEIRALLDHAGGDSLDVGNFMAA